MKRLATTIKTRKSEIKTIYVFVDDKTADVFSRKKVQNLMIELNIISIIAKCYRPNKDKPIQGDFDNLLKRDFTTTGINEKWVSDITYIKTDECGWCYLATILDLYSKRLIGWKFGKKMTVDLVEGALLNALQIRGLDKLLIIHNDINIV